MSGARWVCRCGHVIERRSRARIKAGIALHESVAHPTEQYQQHAIRYPW